MADSVQAELTRLRLIVEDLGARLEAGEVSPEGLPEFKSVLDEMRLRTWALLSAAGSQDPRGTADRFRLRRAAELCRSLTHELSSGRLGAGYPEWPEVQAYATQLSATIAERTGHAA